MATNSDHGRYQDFSQVRDAWNVYSFVYGEGQRAIVSFDLEAATTDEQVEFAEERRVIVYVSAQYVTPNGLPDGDKHRELAQLENELITALAGGDVNCLFVGRMTYGGMREFIFEVGDTHEFDEVVNAWQPSGPAFRAELKSGEAWDFFNRKISPSPRNWQQIHDRQVIEHLVEAGSDRDAVHRLEHTFIGPTESLDIIASELGADDFEQLSREDGRLVMAKGSVLDLDRISGLTGALMSFAANVGAEYDGWGAEVATSG